MNKQSAREYKQRVGQRFEIITGWCLLLLIISIQTCFAAGSGVGIINSPHDFSTQSWNPTGEICVLCHAPHDRGLAGQRYLNGLLWNHDVSQASYTMYDSSWSSSLTGAQSAQPDGVAKLCLGCHDGTIAIDAFDQYAGSASRFIDVDFDTKFKVPGFTNGANLDMRGTHPISIAYDTTADPNLNDPNTTAMGTSGTIADVLDHGKVQCSTCHDVHDQVSVPGSALLRVAQTTAQGGAPSGLCRTCHIK